MTIFYDSVVHEKDFVGILPGYDGIVHAHQYRFGVAACLFHKLMLACEIETGKRFVHNHQLAALRTRAGKTCKTQFAAAESGNMPPGEIIQIQMGKLIHGKLLALGTCLSEGIACRHGHIIYDRNTGRGVLMLRQIREQSCTLVIAAFTQVPVFKKYVAF